MRRGPWIVRPVVGALLLARGLCERCPLPGRACRRSPSRVPVVVRQRPPPPRDAGVVPDDCSRMLPVGELVAVLGLPLDSVVVRTTVGVPAPSVGRLERIDCAYSGTAAAGPDSGKAPARDQRGRLHDACRRPRAVEAQRRGRGRRAPRPAPVGTASGVLVERRRRGAADRPLRLGHASRSTCPTGRCPGKQRPRTCSSISPGGCCRRWRAPRPRRPRARHAPPGPPAAGAPWGRPGAGGPDLGWAACCGWG